MTDGQRCFGVPRLNNHNYQAWKFKMEMHLLREKTWYTIAENPPNPVTEDWNEANKSARAAIGLCVEDNQTSLVRNCTTAKAAWDALKAYHDKASEVYLLKKLARLELSESDDMEQHLQTYTDLVQQVADIGDGLPERLQVALLLCSLPDSYDHLTTALEQRPREELTLQLVKSKLLAESEKRRERSAHSGNSGQALRVDHRRRAGKYGSGGNSSEKVETRTCYGCKQPGHLKKDCPQSNSSGKTKKKQRAPNAKQVQDVPDQPIAWMVGKSEPASWFVDSGASRHMTGNRQFFTALEQTAGTSVLLADGEKAEVAGVGRGIFVGVNDAGDAVEIQMNEVLFVPKLTSGLVSVSALAKKNFEVVFSGNKCVVRRPGGLICAVAERYGNLYRLSVPEQAMVSVQPPHTSRCLHTWHRRLGHREPNTVREIITKHLADGMEVVSCGAETGCECCLEGKMSRIPFPKSVDRGAKEKLDIVHADLSGPMTSTPSGNQYFLCLVDEHTRMAFVYLLRKKSDAASKIRDFVGWCKTQVGKTPTVLQSDGGGEFTGKDLQSFLRAEGIVSQFSAPYSPQQNGVVERRNRYLKEMALCMLLDAKLEQKYWGEAILTATHIQNRVPTRATGMSPYQKWYGKLPSLEHLRIFGCDAWVQIPAQRRKKMEPKARKLVFVGYSSQHKAYRLLDKDTDRITISRDVKFLENWNVQYKRDADERPQTEESVIELEPPAVVAARDVAPEPEVEQEPAAAAPHSDEEGDLEGYHSAEELYHGDEDGAAQLEEENADETRQRNPRRRNRGVLPAALRDFFVGMALADHDEPTTYDQAVSCAEKEEWIAAMDAEYDALISNDTWELVDPPAACNIVGSKWVYKRKLDADGKVERMKARLVAQGFSQRFGTDFEEIFAPVAMATTFRVLLTVAGYKRMHVRHLDIKSAYLYGKLEEVVYMRQPPGYVQAGSERKVCRLKRSIYGLKQAARVWNRTLTGILNQIGLEQCKSDTCLYRKSCVGGGWLYLLIYVDDLLLVSTHTKEIDQIESALEKRLKITRLGDIRSFLGIRVRRNSDGFFVISQSAFIERVKTRFGLEHARGSKYPMDPGYFKVTTDSPKMQSNGDYHKLIGCLLYLAVNSRPDIAATVGILSRKVSSPTETDWTEAKRIVRYLIHTVDYGLVLGSSTKEFQLSAYCDADWAGDSSDRKSCSGFLFRLGGATVAWASRKQSCVAMSTMEAEYVALSEAAREAVWMRRLLTELNETPKLPTIIYEDNRSCLDFAVMDQQKKRSKHIDTRYHYTKHCCSSGEIELQYCSSESMIADILTKPLGSNKVKRFATLMGLVPVPAKEEIGGD